MAKWIFIGENMFECSHCGTAYTTAQLNGLRIYDTDPYEPNFCPNCGADMRAEQTEPSDWKDEMYTEAVQTEPKGEK